MHQVDLIVRVDPADSTKLDIGFFENGEVVYPNLVNQAELGSGGVTNATDDPGFESLNGTYTPGTVLSIDFLGATRVWDGEDFDGFSELPLNVFQGRTVATTSMVSNERVVGPALGEANAFGRIHEHASFYFLAPGETLQGIWLLPFELYTSDGLTSEPLFFVVHQLADETEIEAALAWTTQNRVAPCRDTDVDASGSSDYFDVVALLDDYFRPDAATLTADVDRDLDNDADDLSAFVARLAEPCDD
ncbi:MAG: hypothetical protein AAF747_10885 [Planctomycetota bacterium]